MPNVSVKLSAYEKRRQEKIAVNNAYLAQLGIEPLDKARRRSQQRPKIKKVVCVDTKDLDQDVAVQRLEALTGAKERLDSFAGASRQFAECTSSHLEDVRMSRSEIEDFFERCRLYKPVYIPWQQLEQDHDGKFGCLEAFALVVAKQHEVQHELRLFPRSWDPAVVTHDDLARLHALLSYECARLADGPCGLAEQVARKRRAACSEQADAPLDASFHRGDRPPVKGDYVVKLGAGVCPLLGRLTSGELTPAGRKIHGTYASEEYPILDPTWRLAKVSPLEYAALETAVRLTREEAADAITLRATAVTLARQLGAVSVEYARDEAAYSPAILPHLSFLKDVLRICDELLADVVSAAERAGTRKRGRGGAVPASAALLWSSLDELQRLLLAHGVKRDLRLFGSGPPKRKRNEEGSAQKGRRLRIEGRETKRHQ